MAFDRHVAADEVPGGLIHGILTYFLGQTEHQSESRREAAEEAESETCRDPSVEEAGEEGGDTSPGPDSESQADDRANNSCHQPLTSTTERNFDGDSCNKENETLRNWPSVSFTDEVHDGGGGAKRGASPKRAKKMSTQLQTATARQCAPSGPNGMCPATQLVDDLAAVLGGTSLSGDAGDATDGPAASAAGPATMAVSTSSGATSALRPAGGSATYSASTFASHQDQDDNAAGASASLSPGSPGRRRQHPSRDSNASASSMRSSKKMSWSDEHQNRSLVEYFDESSAGAARNVPQAQHPQVQAVPRQSRHWSAMRRNSAAQRRSGSFDEVSQPQSAAGPAPATRRGKKRVLKGVLRRSGSYSPPVVLHASRPGSSSSSGTLNASESTSSTAESSSMAGARSFRSISLVGSQSSQSNSGSSDDGDAPSPPSGNDQRQGEGGGDPRWVPSTLRGGGGIVMPRGGPMAVPAGGGGGRYQVQLGAGFHAAQHHRDANGAAEQGASTSPLSKSARSGGGRPPPSQFLPHSNGYISPQYGTSSFSWH